MRLRTLSRGMGLFVVLLAASAAASAQEPRVSDATVESLPLVIPEKGIPEEKLKEPVIHWEAAEQSVRAGFIGSAEYLFLKPRRRDLDFVIVDSIDNGRPEGFVESADWEARSGVRAGLAYRFASGWEAGFVYTYFHSDRAASVTAPQFGTLYATWTHPGTVEQVAAATALTSLTYNVFDAEVGRWYHPCGALDLRPFGGLRFAQIDQGLDIFYDGRDAANDMVQSPIEFEGGGIRVGGEGEWRCCCGLGFYGRAAASLLMGNFRTLTAETNDGGLTPVSSVADNFQKIVPVIELGLGVAYKYRNLRLRAGYEFTNWFGLVDSTDFADDVHQGKIFHRWSDLSLDGLAIRAELAF
jgi:hypothetical protein